MYIHVSSGSTVISLSRAVPSELALTAQSALCARADKSLHLGCGFLAENVSGI